MTAMPGGAMDLGVITAHKTCDVMKIWAATPTIFIPIGNYQQSFVQHPYYFIAWKHPGLLNWWLPD